MASKQQGKETISPRFASAWNRVTQPDAYLVPHVSCSDYQLPNTATAEAQGRRRSMEDAHLITKASVAINGNEHALQISAVFDGHAGASASDFCSKQLTSCLLEQIKQCCKEKLDAVGMFNALKLTPVTLDRNYTGRAGTTANITVQEGNNLWVANVGDSRALLITPAGTAVQLSEDAKPDDERYKRSIIKRGGMVITRHVPRINGMLAVGRAIGDHFLNGAASPRPKIVHYTLPEESSGYILIQACDGIFDVATTNGVAKLVHANRDLPAEQLAKLLVAAAYEADSTDNLSVIVRKM